MQTTQLFHLKFSIYTVCRVIMILILPKPPQPQTNW